ncbi:MAG: dCMP deaminase [Rhizobiales bacterium]|nr:dCMP deaminase [Hyphomicrobiales bacterium]
MRDTNTPNWDDYFMSMLPMIASRSKDPDTKVGCIIVGADHTPRTTGYNGLVSGIDDNRPERWSRENGEKYFWCEHAERNAIFSAARNGVALEGATIYTSLMPCVDCARGIIQSGIVRVVTDRAAFEARAAVDDKWAASHNRALRHFSERRMSLTLWVKS